MAKKTGKRTMYIAQKKKTSEGLFEKMAEVSFFDRVGEFYNVCIIEQKLVVQRRPEKDKAGLVDVKRTRSVVPYESRCQVAHT